MNMGTISRYGAGVADMDRDRGIWLVFFKMRVQVQRGRLSLKMGDTTASFLLRTKHNIYINFSKLKVRK